MKAYELEDGRTVYIDSWHKFEDDGAEKEGVKVEVSENYQTKKYHYEDRKAYLRLLFRKRDGTTAREYLFKTLPGARIKKVVF